jgi:hypothetical protein
MAATRYFIGDFIGLLGPSKMRDSICASLPEMYEGRILRTEARIKKRLVPFLFSSIGVEGEIHDNRRKGGRGTYYIHNKGFSLCVVPFSAIPGGPKRGALHKAERLVHERRAVAVTCLKLPTFINEKERGKFKIRCTLADGKAIQIPFDLREHMPDEAENEAGDEDGFYALALKNENALLEKGDKATLQRLDVVPSTLDTPDTHADSGSAAEPEAETGEFDTDSEDEDDDDDDEDEAEADDDEAEDEDDVMEANAGAGEDEGNHVI